MKALVFEGEKRGLVYKELDNANSVTQKVLVKVLFSAINRRDYYISKGLYPGVKVPIVLGSDAVVQFEYERYLVNPNIGWGEDKDFQSDSYSILGMPEDGAFSEYMLITRNRLCPCPEYLSDPEAAAIPLAGLTAYRALITKAELKSTDVVFISGFGGGVASLAFQIAIAKGCTVYVSSSSSEKRAFAIKHGAAKAIDYNVKGYGKKLYKDFGGVDVVVDSAGGDGFDELVTMCRKGGKIVIYGGTRGKMSVNPQKLFWKQLSILGTTMGSDDDFNDMVNYIQEHEIRPFVSDIIPLSEGRRAFDLLEKGGQMGKIVLDNSK